MYNELLADYVFNDNTLNESATIKKIESLNEDFKENFVTRIAATVIRKFTSSRKNNPAIKEFDNTKGDITKYKGYQDYKKIVTKLATYSLPKESKDILRNIQSLEKNLISNKGIFKEAYTRHIIASEIKYSSMAYTLFNSAKLFSAWVFTKGHNGDLVFNDNLTALRKCTTIKELYKCNKEFSSGSVIKNIKIINKDSNKLNESIVDFLPVAGEVAPASIKFAKSMMKGHPIATISTIIILVIVSSRYTIFTMIAAKQAISNKLAEASRLLKENIVTLDSEKQSTVIKKQRAMADRYQQWADRLQVKEVVDDTKTDRAISQVDEKDSTDIAKETKQDSGDTKTLSDILGSSDLSSQVF